MASRPGAAHEGEARAMPCADSRPAGARSAGLRFMLLAALLVAWTVLAVVAGASMVHSRLAAELEANRAVVASLTRAASVQPRAEAPRRARGPALGGRRLAWAGLAERDDVVAGTGCVVIQSFEFDESMDLSMNDCNFTRCPPCFVFNGSFHNEYNNRPFKLTLKHCSTMRISNVVRLGGGRFLSAAQRLDFINLAGSMVIVSDDHTDYRIPPSASTSATCSTSSGNRISMAGSFEVARTEAFQLSKAGAVWTDTGYAGIPSMMRHQMVESSSGRLWIYGGMDSYPIGKIYWSDNGESWRGHSCNYDNDGCFFRTRYNHAVVQMGDGTLLFIGGRSEDCSDVAGDEATCTDVWSSVTGENWTLETSNHGMTDRFRIHATAFGGHAYVIAGANESGDATLSDVWQSDGVGGYWYQQSYQSAFGVRARHAVAARSDGALLVVGGVDEWGDLLNDVWCSTDQGIDWFNLTVSAAWAPRYDLSAVIRGDGHLLIIGGATNDDEGFYDVWQSADGGSNWGRLTDKAFSYARSNMAVVARRDGSILVVGGQEHYYRRLQAVGGGKRRLQTTLAYTTNSIYVSGKPNEW